MKINLWKDMFTFIFVERDVELVRRATLIIPVGWLHGTGRQESKRNLRSGRMHICQEKRKWKEWKTDKRREVKLKERPFGRTLKRKKSEVRITPATELVYVTWSFHWNSKNYVSNNEAERDVDLRPTGTGRLSERYVMNSIKNLFAKPCEFFRQEVFIRLHYLT